MMEGLKLAVVWMLAGGLVAWWGVWPFVGRSLAGVGSMLGLPTVAWLVVAAGGLTGTAYSLELRVGAGAFVDLGPLVAALTVALLGGVAATWLMPPLTARPATGWRVMAVGALVLLVVTARPGVVDPSFVWELLVVGAPRLPAPVPTGLLILAVAVTAALGARVPRRLVRGALSQRRTSPSAPLVPWVAGAMLLVPAVPVVGLASALVTALFVPSLAVVSRPRGTALAPWSALLGCAVGWCAGLGISLGLPGGALAVLVVALVGSLPWGRRSSVEGGAP